MSDPTSGPDSPGNLRPVSELAPKDRRLRAWPALLLVALMVVARLLPNFLEGGMSSYWMIAMMGPLAGCVLLIIWWLAASRATWRERVVGLLGLVVSLGLTLLLVHPTMRGPGTVFLTLPVGMVLFALATVVLAGRSPLMRTGLALLVAFAGFGSSILLRNEGLTGGYVLTLRWRWSPTAEAELLAARKPVPSAGSRESNGVSDGQVFANPEWPGFRGLDRSARARGAVLATNWTAHPPKQLWRIPVGPGWSSFAVAGRFLFTQEQRGPMETVMAYEADTGREIWSRPIEARFDDPMGGPGPRATPTIAGDSVFVAGATGLVIRLKAATGEVVWQQDLKTVAGRDVPMWGFSASPLVTGGVVIVYAGGAGDKGLLGFDLATGALRWSAAAGNDTYSSPQLNAVAGEELVLLLSNDGLLFVEPATGRTRLNYEWKFGNYRALQAGVAAADTFLLPTGMNVGTRAIRVTRSGDQLAAAELWTSRNLKPDFSDFVIYQGHAYGNDGGVFTCVDLTTGDRKWKGGRYGKGQVLLLENSGLLLIAAEDGRVVLLRADPNDHVELDSFKALSGKTWNHPVVVGDRLYIRNSQEAAGYQLPVADGQ